VFVPSCTPRPGAGGVPAPAPGGEAPARRARPLSLPEPPHRQTGILPQGKQLGTPLFSVVQEKNGFHFLSE